MSRFPGDQFELEIVVFPVALETISGLFQARFLHVMLKKRNYTQLLAHFKSRDKTQSQSKYMIIMLQKKKKSF